MNKLLIWLWFTNEEPRHGEVKLPPNAMQSVNDPVSGRLAVPGFPSEALTWSETAPFSYLVWQELGKCSFISTGETPWVFHLLITQ